jgi:transcriptional regulator with XRE-family HTH domain
MPPNLQARFGEIIRRRRDGAGLSQEAVGHAAGLSRNYVGMLERGERVPTIVTLQQLAKALATTMTDLIRELEGGEEAEE